MEFFTEYHYLAASAVLLLLSVSTIFVLPRHRVSLLLSGLLSMPMALLSCQHIPWYWQPKLTARYITTVEDVLFTTSIGIICWFLAILPFSSRIEISPKTGQLIGRFSCCTLAGLLVIQFALILAGTLLAVMPATIIAMGVLAVALLAIRIDLLLLAVSGGVGYMLFHFVDMSATIAVWPEVRSYWNPAAQLPFDIFGFPAYEFIWALGFGFVWPLLVGYTCNARWRQENSTGLIT